MTKSEILNTAIKSCEKENEFLDRDKFNDIQILDVIFKCLDIKEELLTKK